MNSIYADPVVRQRLVEYMGGESLAEATAVYLTHSDGCQFRRSELLPPWALECLLDQQLDVARSLADRESLLLHLDLEYVNFDVPEAAFTDPSRSFAIQEPVVEVIWRVLREFGIEPLHVLTGQGHHFVWRVELNSMVAGRIEALDPAPELVAACMERVGPGIVAAVDSRMQGCFAGIALLMEFLAQRIKFEAAPLCALPVEITAVHVGPCATRQREMVSIDISEYGDPLHTRMVRMPFSNYLKPWMNELGIGGRVPRFCAIPLVDMDVRQALRVRASETGVLALARRADVRVPLQERGTARLLEVYLASPLRGFHEDFYSERHHPPELWGQTYDKTPMEIFPPCARILLDEPNDRLLKPAGIQLVTRVLLAEGWHPRHIAGLIRSRFENTDFDWGVDWQDYEPATRADFYVRLFAGLWAMGVDRLVDFNCVSTQEKGFCHLPEPGGCSLEEHYKRIGDKTD